MTACACAVSAKPFVPAHDQRVLERLPYTPGDSSTRELRIQRRALTRAPNNVALAVEAASEYIVRARAQGDPRYFGYAQAALGPWSSKAKPPVVILVLRAQVKQASHRFIAALKDLDRALQRDPGNLDAALTRAIILQVLGRYEQAQRDCSSVAGAAQRISYLQLTALTCTASVASFSGKAAQSYAVLKRALVFAYGASVEDQQWALTTLADIATRLGRARAAANHFRAALALGENVWLLNAYADFLLARDRSHEVIELLADDTDVDSLLLLLALAEKRIDAPTLDEHVEALRRRFAAARLRNDQRHLREEARFTLRLLEKPQAALRLARANWRIQHEPEDARVLLEAALAAEKPTAAAPVIRFLAQTGLQDVRLKRLAQRLKPADGA